MPDIHCLSTKQHEVISKTGQIVPYPFDDESVFAYGSYVSGKTEDKTGETLANQSRKDMPLLRLN